MNYISDLVGVEYGPHGTGSSALETIDREKLLHRDIDTFTPNALFQVAIGASTLT